MTGQPAPRPPAPLAQLRTAHPQVWRQLMDPCTRHANPGNDCVTQALAAALLGNIRLANRILREGSPVARWQWPELRK